MKRMILLPLALLCLIFLPALAEETDSAADLCAQLLPGYAYVEGEMGEDLCALLADSPDGERRFYGCVFQDGAWNVTESTPLPADAELYLEDWPLYDTCVIGFYHPTRGNLPWMEHYVTWDGEGWAVTLSTMNAGDLIRYEEGYIGSDMHDDWYGVPTFALDVTAVDWLNLPATFEEAMACMDTAGCEALNADWSAWEEEADAWAPDAEAVAFGQAHLPGYTVYDGRAFDDTALLLADDEHGVRYFFGCVKEDGEWVITRSTPLPEGSWCETFHAGWNWLRVWIPLPREKQTVRTGFTEVRCTVAYFGGAWQVSSLEVADGYMSFDPHGISEDTGDTYWGELPLDRDVTRIDWNALPGSFQQALDMMDMSDWMIVCENAAPLYAEPDAGSALLGRYLLGAPVKRLNEQDGMVQVQIISSDVTGWMDAAALLPASEQGVYDEEYDDLSSRYYLDEIYLGEDDAVLPLRTVLHDDASAFPVSADKSAWLDVLGVCPAGCCYHVYAESADASAYLPLIELPVAQQITALILPAAPGMSVRNGMASDTAFIATLENQEQPALEEGPITLACGVLLDGEWEITLSNPLPEGAGAMLRYDMEGARGTLVIRFPDAGELIYTLQYQDGWTATGGETVDFTLFPASVPDLTGYVLIDGWEGSTTRMYLAENAAGNLVFLGCERTAEGWNITESAPFPDVEVWLNTYHAYEGCMEINLPEVGVAVALQEDGRWLLTWANDVSIGDTGLWFGMLGPYYCDVNLEQDITLLDWAALPAYEDWLPLTDASRWAVVTGDAAPLYGDDGRIRVEYLPATPVLLLESANGQHRVAVNGGSVTGWMNDADLLIGEAQLTTEEGYLAVAEDGRMRGVNRLITVELVPLLDSPEGAPVLGEVEDLVLLGQWPDGWLHVLDDSTGLDGFVRKEDCITLDEWLDRLYDEYGI